jgi:hypothetical protein
MMPGSSRRRAIQRNPAPGGVLDEHNRPIARLAPARVDRFAQLRFVGAGCRGEDAERLVDVPDCSRSSAMLNGVLVLDERTLPLRSNSTPRGAGSGSAGDGCSPPSRRTSDAARPGRSRRRREQRERRATTICTADSLRLRFG